jgi:hypothetical protein
MKIMNLKNHSKKVVTALIVAGSTAIIIFLALLPIIIFIENNEIHNYEIKYDENFIIGNDYITIVNEYGEFDLTFGEFDKGNFRGGYFVKFDYINGNERLYFIEFNSEMIATKTYIRQRPGG